MGIRFSKKRASGGDTGGSISAGGSMECRVELSSYEPACQVDPKIQTIDENFAPALTPPLYDEESPVMGIQFSKRCASGGGTSGSVSAGGNMEYMAEQSLNEVACQVQTFDAGLQQRTSRFNSDMFVNVQLPFASLNKAAGPPFDMNQDAIRINLESKKDKLNNFEMFPLVDDFFDNSVRASDSFKKARDSQLIIELAIKSFEEEYVVAAVVSIDEDDQPPEVMWKTRYAKTRDEMRRFKAIGDSFTNEIYKAFQSVNPQQLSMLENLQNRKVEQERKLKSVKIWRNVTCIIFLSIVATLHICSVVAAIVATSHIAAALAAAAAIPLVSIVKLFDSMWKEYQDTLKAKNELINTMHAGTYVVLADLNSIGILVNLLEDYRRSSLDDAKFVLKDEETVRVSIEEMENLIVFMKSIKNLVELADRCSGVLRTARTMALQRITELLK